MTRFFRLLSCGALATSILTIGSAAFAQASSAEKAATAQALYEDAMKSVEAKDFAKACPQLERVTQLVPEGIGAKLSLAECYEGADKLASSYGVYVAIEGQARRAGQNDRADLAVQRMQALKPKLAMITLDVPADIKGQAGFSLKRDGVAVSDVEYGLPIALDKGDHTLTASAEGQPAWEKTFSVEDGKAATVKVEGPMGAAPGGGIPGAGTPGGGTPGAGTPGAGTPGTPEAHQVGSFFGPGRIAGLSIGIAGVVSAGVGIGLGVVGKGQYDDSNTTGGCNADTNFCSTQDGVDMRDSALTMANASTALVVIGGAMAVGGVVLFIVAPGQDDGDEASAAPAAVSFGVGPGSVVVRGSF